VKSMNRGQTQELNQTVRERKKAPGGEDVCAGGRKKTPFGGSRNAKIGMKLSLTPANLLTRNFVKRTAPIGPPMCWPDQKGGGVV